MRGPAVSERAPAPSPSLGPFARGFEELIDFHPKGLITLLTVNSRPAVRWGCQNGGGVFLQLSSLGWLHFLCEIVFYELYSGTQRTLKASSLQRTLF